MFDNSCVEKICNSQILIQENGKKLKVLNSKKKVLRKIKFDSCVISKVSNQKSCDYGLWVENRSYFIELKGKRIEYALEQILDTIKFCKTNHADELTDIKEKYALIISSKNSVPKLKTNSIYLKLSKEIGNNNICIKNNVMELEV